MLKINDIRVSIDEELTAGLIASEKDIKKEDIKSFKIIKKSVDARKKNDIHYTYSVCAELLNEKKYEKRKGFEKAEEKNYEFPKAEHNVKNPLIVGSGPCGLFAALCLAKAGAEPIVAERGYDVDKRSEAINKFWKKGIFDEKSNVQFGEGGAGTFSDGKLNTGVNDVRMKFIKETFVKNGAPEEIMYMSKPHIGTDKLRITVKNIRKEIISLGGKFLFETKFIDFIEKDGKICGAILEKDGIKKEISCSQIILATGHSARDVFELLKKRGLKMQRKTFSIGARIEHLQSDIGYSQYGEAYKKLPAADYKLSVRTGEGRGVYTFCMCPGGYVVASCSEENTVVTNGMSYYKRDGENANSAVLVTVNPSDIEGDDVLGGMYLQREIEKKAFETAGKNYFAPVQKTGDFLNDIPTTKLGKVTPTYMPGVSFCELKEIFPDFITNALREALPLFDRKLKGFADPDSILTAPEARSSSPVRILRDKETYETEIKGLYPCGEGAGYAGGIMSAACDGIKCAEAIILNNSRI